jgi:hypothetical protein
MLDHSGGLSQQGRIGAALRAMSEWLFDIHRANPGEYRYIIENIAIELLRPAYGIGFEWAFAAVM